MFMEWCAGCGDQSRRTKTLYAGLKSHSSDRRWNLGQASDVTFPTTNERLYGARRDRDNRIPPLLKMLPVERQTMCILCGCTVASIQSNHCSFFVQFSGCDRCKGIMTLCLMRWIGRG